LYEFADCLWSPPTDFKELQIGAAYIDLLKKYTIFRQSAFRLGSYDYPVTNGAVDEAVRQVCPKYSKTSL
jgi:hypothetical protein